MNFLTLIPLLFGLMFSFESGAACGKDLAAILDKLLQEGVPLITKENFRDLAIGFDHYVDPSDPMKRAWDNYLGEYSTTMNSVLRKENPDFTKVKASDLEEVTAGLPKDSLTWNDEQKLQYKSAYARKNAFHLERMFEVNGMHLEEGVILHRAIGLKEADIPRAGSPWIDHAFMSTSFDAPSANFISNSNWGKEGVLQVFLKITNKGFKGKVLPGHYGEGEIILPRNTSLFVKSVERKENRVFIEADLF